MKHHTDAHGQRYQADMSKASSLPGLVKSGAARIAKWAMDNNYTEAAESILADRLDGKSAKRASARNIP